MGDRIWQVLLLSIAAIGSLWLLAVLFLFLQDHRDDAQDSWLRDNCEEIAKLAKRQTGTTVDCPEPPALVDNIRRGG